MGNAGYFGFRGPRGRSTTRANCGRGDVFHGLEAADELYEARELWKTYCISRFGRRGCATMRANYGKGKVVYVMDTADEWATRANYGKPKVFHWEAADELYELRQL
jgi:hypothetical protein